MGIFKRYLFTSHEEDCLGINSVEIPTRATIGSSGYDIKSAVDRVIPPRSVMMIPTGLACELDFDEELQIRCRSGLASKGIMIANGVGTIDSDYEGHIQVLLYNSTDYPYKISSGDRIAQGVFCNYHLASDDPDNNIWYDIRTGKISKSDIKSNRGHGGFGSTGV